MSCRARLGAYKAARRRHTICLLPLYKAGMRQHFRLYAVSFIEGVMLLFHFCSSMSSRDEWHEDARDMSRTGIT